MGAVGDMGYRDIRFVEAFPDIPPHPPGDLPVQAAHRVALVGHLQGQDRHEEGFPFAALLHAQLPELRPGDPGPLHKVREVVFDQLLAEPFVSRLHRRMGGKYGASAHELARLVEGEPVLRHQRADPLEQQEGRVPFVDMVDAGADPQPLEEPDAPIPNRISCSIRVRGSEQ